MDEDIIYKIKHMIRESIPHMSSRLPHIKILENMVLLHWQIFDGQDDLWDMFLRNNGRYTYFTIIKTIFETYNPEYRLDVHYKLGPIAIRNKIYSQIIVSYFRNEEVDTIIEE